MEAGLPHLVSIICNCHTQLISISTLITPMFIMFCFSMMDVNTGLNKNIEGFIPSVCTESPATGKAFCIAHCEKVAALGYPTGLCDFLKSCGDVVQPDSYTKVNIILLKFLNIPPTITAQFCPSFNHLNLSPKDMKKIVDKEIKKISKKIDSSSVNVRSSTDVQGTSYLLRKREFKNVDNFYLEGEGDDCNK